MIVRTVAVVAAAVSLMACGEKPQDSTASAKLNAPAYQGTGVASFTAPGWKAGDQNSWAQELRARGQRGQNEYNRVQQTR